MFFVGFLDFFFFSFFVFYFEGVRWDRRGESCHKEGEGYSGMAPGQVPLLCQEQLKRAQVSHDAGEYRMRYGTHCYCHLREGGRDRGWASRNKTVCKWRLKNQHRLPKLA